MSKRFSNITEEVWLKSDRYAFVLKPSHATIFLSGLAILASCGSIWEDNSNKNNITDISMFKLRYKTLL